MTTKTTTVLDARAVERTLKRMSVEIVELNRGTDDLIVVGIQRRGVQLADRIVKMIDGGEGVAVPQGSLDITLYRDDLQTIGPRPVVGPTYLPWDIDGQHIVIVDDVLYTGRTLAFCLQPFLSVLVRKLQVAVLVDRNHPRYPVAADYKGYELSTTLTDHVEVVLSDPEREGIYLR